MNTTKHTGPATLETMHQLHRLLIDSCLTKVSQRAVAVDELTVVRQLIKDNTLTMTAITDDERAKLQKLWTLLLKQLLKALKADHPSASVLEEARLFLGLNGITKDSQGYTSKAQALEHLGDVGVPFTTH
jgi:ABC-type sugar transport system substrate-binding protein